MERSHSQRGKRKKLIALGEQDMNQALKDLHAKAAGGSG
jgi:hypothetical protein